MVNHMKCPDQNCGGEMLPSLQRGARGWLRYSCYGCGSTFIQSPAGAAVAMVQIEQRRAPVDDGETTAEPDKSKPTTAEHEENRRILSKYGIFTD